MSFRGRAHILYRQSTYGFFGISWSHDYRHHTAGRLLLSLRWLSSITRGSGSTAGIYRRDERCGITTRDRGTCPTRTLGVWTRPGRIAPAWGRPWTRCIASSFARPAWNMAAAAGAYNDAQWLHLVGWCARRHCWNGWSSFHRSIYPRTTVDRSANLPAFDRAWGWDRHRWYASTRGFHWTDSKARRSSHNPDSFTGFD